ncbi:hypothetical protein SBOR_10053 [Sclerotinia borealis F-4128]|uniref:DNase1 protein n=1 Tax=Sclerotinia borealis (strain F-4128) TaxID=1432307 RepID=W9BY87_SCLBF|nr:hypothetical protein SBOR_10053 [Sclerotinia borealis F-4128]
MRTLFARIALVATAVVNTLFGLASAEGERNPNVLIIKNMDNHPRELHFRAEGPASLLSHKMIGHNIQITAGDTHWLEVPYGWNGNFVAFVIGSAPKEDRVLAEFAFQVDGRIGTWYDVSAVTTHNDQEGVHWIYPLSEAGDKSGCETFPCETSYKVWNHDKNTKYTTDTRMVIELYSS